MSQNRCALLIEMYRFFILILIPLFLPGVATAANPVPLVNSPLIPSAIAPGGAGFTLSVHGTGFVAGAVVRWNGSARPTKFVTSSQLTATVSGGDISRATTASITVSNPSPGGGSSNVVFFQVRTPDSWAAFGPARRFTVGAGPESLVTGDFNGDHRLDLAVPNPNSNNLSILLGNGDGTFKPNVKYRVGQSPTVAAVGDFNHDGKLDVLVANNSSNDVSVLLGKGDGTFQTAVEQSVGKNPAALALGDFNRDGKLDAVVTDAGSGQISVLLGNGAGSFQSVKTYAVGRNPVSVAVGDFNRDGKLDLAVANHDSNNVSLLLGNGDGSFRAAVNHGGTPNAASVAAADLNGDGKLDLLVANALGFNVTLFLGNGDGSFQPGKSYSTGFEPSLAVGDLNGDGHLDLAIANIGAGSVSTLLGDGHGGLQGTVGYIVPTNALSVALGDFNGDGKLDMAVPDAASDVSVLLQTHPLAGPNATLSGTSIRFQCRNVINTGCQCASKATLTLGNFGSQTLNIAGITITGPFSETNNCGRSLGPGRFCSVSVTWQKVSGLGTLSFADDASGGLQTVSLSGAKSCSGVATDNTAGPVACEMNPLELR